MGGGGPRLEQSCLSRAHLEPGGSPGHPLQAERGRGRLPGLDLRQSQPRGAALGKAQRVAGRGGPLLEKGPVLYWGPLPCRHSRLAQALTGPSSPIVSLELKCVSHPAMKRNACCGGCVTVILMK